MIKVRFYTWYWGRYTLVTKEEASNLPLGFELYDEGMHGWYNSGEWMNFKNSMLENDQPCLFETMKNSGFVESQIKRFREAEFTGKSNFLTTGKVYDIVLNGDIYAKCDDGHYRKYHRCDFGEIKMKTGLYFDPCYPEHDLFYDGVSWWWIDLEYNWINHANGTLRINDYELVMGV